MYEFENRRLKSVGFLSFIVVFYHQSDMYRIYHWWRTSVKRNKKEEYATLQIKREVKDQVADYCNRKGLKIGRFIETIFLQAVSGSAKEH
jgi:hypothetical protein